VSTNEQKTTGHSAEVAAQITIEQFKNLRGQIDDAVKSVRNVELYTIAGLTAYYSWLLSKPMKSVSLELSSFEVNARTIFLFYR
jgi:hypothetical protein